MTAREADAEPVPHHGFEPHRRTAAIDTSYRLVVRTVLWVIAGLVSLAFAIGWALT